MDPCLRFNYALSRLWAAATRPLKLMYSSLFPSTFLLLSFYFICDNGGIFKLILASINSCLLTALFSIALPTSYAVVLLHCCMYVKQTFQNRVHFSSYLLRQVLRIKNIHVLQLLQVTKHLAVHTLQLISP